MKKIILFIAVITFMITSCEKDSSQSAKQAETVQTDPNAEKYAKIVNDAVRDFLSVDRVAKDNGKDDKGKDKQKTKDFKIAGSGAITYIPDGCGAGTLKFKSKGEAKSNLLGKVDQKTSFCIDAATGQITTLPSGVAEDKDGNKLNYSLAGAGVDAATGFNYQVYSITGGTGDYKHASGSMTLLYHIFTPTNFAYTGTGTMTF